MPGVIEHEKPGLKMKYADHTDSFTNQKAKLAGHLPAASEVTNQGETKTKSVFFETSMPGVLAVGDCATPLKAVIQAVAMWSFGAGGLVG